MRSRIGSSASTILMLLPLVVVPALAMFGVTDPRTLDASADQSEETVADIGQVDLGVGQSAFHDAADLLSDPVPSDGFTILDPTSAPPPRRTRPDTPNWEDPFDSWNPSPGALEGWSVENDQPSVHNDVTGQFDDLEREGQQTDRSDQDAFPGNAGNDIAQRGTQPPIAPPSTGQPNFESQLPPERPQAADELSWKTAIARLNQLGISHYQLEPGSDPSEFHFSCSLTLAENPRVTHRFEAQADDPLHAVSDVLAQIEASQGNR